MFRKILVATDGSPKSRKAVETALRLKLQTPDIDVAIIHVSEVPSKTSVESCGESSLGIVVLPESTRISIIRERDEILEEARIIAEEMGVKVKLLSKTGDPASVIVDEAEKGGYDLIIIGGEGFGKSRILGNVASKVLNQFKGSVLVVR
ncbi:MAG: universal stress protein [Candidatus Brockarchaeota archaeon]|nr:universal stress protein [Candidatus Brockarchaeota archaeon]